MQRTIVFCLVAILMAWLSHLAGAEDSTVIKADTIKTAGLHSSVVVAANATSAASTAWRVGDSTNQSLQVTLASSAVNPSVAILVTGSVDETTFGTPTTGATVTTLTEDGTHLITLSLPVVQQIKVYAVNASSTVNSTVTITGAKQ